MVRSSLEHLIHRIRQLIGEGEIAPALDQLRDYLFASAPELYNEVIVQSARYRRLLRGERAGLVTRELFEVEQNRLSRSLLDLLDDLPDRVDQTVSPLGTDVALVAKDEAVHGVVDPEKILGINNLRQISWIEHGLRAARSVGRILTPGGLGTGFLFGPGLLMTNHHVIPTSKVAGESVVEFDYQQDAAGRLLPTVRYRLDVGRFHTSAELDYSFVGVLPAADKPPLDAWGRLHANPDADPVPTEYVSIVQHPNGGLKQIVLTGSSVVSRHDHLLHYTTDTMPGSSGSPVFNDSWHVIAIHHATKMIKEDGKSRYVNEGILMSGIRHDAGELWPGA